MQQVYVVLGKRLSHEKYLEAKGNNREATVLHPDAQLRIDALLAICNNAPVDIAVFSGGQTSGFGLPSEAHSLWDKFLKSDYGKHRPACLLDEESLNTNENATRVKLLLEKVPYFTLRVITSGYHAPRAKEIFLAQGINVEVLVAEAVIANLVPSRKAEMAKYKESMHVKLETVREWISRKLSRKFLTKLAHIFR